MQHNSSDNTKLIAICLEQAGQICMALREGTVIQNEGSLKCYTVIDKDAFAKLLKKSEVLINYFDTFILKKQSQKIRNVHLVGQYNMDKMDLYEHLCYATGILHTMLSVLPKKTVPQYIKSEKQRIAVENAVWEAPYFMRQSGKHLTSCNKCKHSPNDLWKLKLSQHVTVQYLNKCCPSIHAWVNNFLHPCVFATQNIFLFRTPSAQKENNTYQGLVLRYTTELSRFLFGGLKVRAHPACTHTTWHTHHPFCFM